MKLLRHLAGYLPVNIASGIAAFGGVYVFTRLLGPEEYGRYARMFSVMTLVHLLSLTAAESAAVQWCHSCALPTNNAWQLPVPRINRAKDGS